MIDAPQVTTPATRLPDSKPSGTAAGRHRQNLIWALALTSAFMAIEVVGGLWTGSLALLRVGRDYGNFGRKPINCMS